MAIHKSVAQFVDKEHRTKAKKDNCYTKKTGIFAKEFSEIFKPAFKEEYNSKEFYFEINDYINTNSNFENNPNNLSELYTYVNDIIKNISRKHWEDYPLTGSPLNINSDRLD